jgi:secreted PhoX family phosphatase
MLRKQSFRKSSVALGVSAAILAMSVGLTGCNGDDGTDGVDGVDGVDGADGITNLVPPGLKRLATAPLGAEFTGMYLNSDNTFFLNVQHPSSSNTTTDTAGKAFNKGTVGAIVGQDFSSLPLDFDALDLPVTTAEKEVVMTAVGSYQVLTQQNDVADDGYQMGDILAADGTTLIKSSNDPDFNGVISDGDSGFYVYTNWEDRPGSMGRIHVSNLTASGYGTINLNGMIDFSSVGGTWVNCFGTVSPWNTPLSSEELYFDDTADWFDSSYTYFSNPQSLATYFGYPTDGSGDWPNPYRYGYIVELTNPADGVLTNVVPNKLETMGRFSHENSVVMPDQKTVFLSDDGNGVVFFKFVADVAGNMSAGTLYAAKVTQANANDPQEAAFAIEWVELANMNETDLETAIASFDGTFAEANYITDEQVCDWAESKKGADLDCDTDTTVDANPFADDRVAFLESRKAAVALGATGEFNKMEGVNINWTLASDWWNAGAADGPQAYMYMAMSSFDKTMSDDEGTIQLDGTNGKCGVVYRMKLVENADGNVDVTTMMPAIVGGPYYADRSVNECNVNNISNPDNLVILEDGRVLIGEDTGNHENNVIWVFDDPAI